jgi:hypothetical protein
MLKINNKFQFTRQGLIYLVVISLVIALLFCLAFLWGFYTKKNNIFPYYQLRQIYEGISSDSQERIKPDLTIESEVIGESFLDPSSKRKYLETALLIPKSLTKVERKTVGKAQIISATLYGVTVKATLAKAAVEKKCLRIYIDGHGSSSLYPYTSRENENLISGGCDVLFMSMLGIDVNAGNASFPTRFGQLNLDMTQAKNHGNYSFFYDKSNKQLDPLSIFISPHYYIIKAITDGYKNISLIGLSGGGWYVTFLSALMPDINTSVSYAGTLPFEYRKFSKNHGDWEQVYSHIYNRISYWSLYFLGTLNADYAATRVLYLIYNSNDPCCFSSPFANHFKGILESFSLKGVKVIIVKKTEHQLDFSLINLLLGNEEF